MDKRPSITQLVHLLEDISPLVETNEVKNEEDGDDEDEDIADASSSLRRVPISSSTPHLICPEEEEGGEDGERGEGRGGDSMSSTFPRRRRRGWDGDGDVINGKNVEEVEEEEGPLPLPIPNRPPSRHRFHSRLFDTPQDPFEAKMGKMGGCGGHPSSIPRHQHQFPSSDSGGKVPKKRRDLKGRYGVTKMKKMKEVKEEEEELPKSSSSNSPSSSPRYNPITNTWG